MRKEINRMEHKHGELKRRQEKLIQEMEKAIYKRQLIQTKALSAAARNEGGSSSSSASLKGRAAKKDEMTKAGLKKACAALKKSIRETESGGAEADARIERLEDDGVCAATEADRFSAEIERLRVEESTLRAERDAKAREREVLQLEAAKSARMRKRFEDVVEGRHRVLASDEDVVADLEKARRRREKLLSAVEDACEAAPHLWPSLERALTLLSI
ncbi:uncharacterized protein MICPUCDRAFT_49303 [Micromonas pusilla CCMP1545]|uniref:Predicted protein n=1 Tax=Micromonas pusilla (strain CCMP1545) TaxID=564608 RepID=C1N9Y4_MICPC|nr:uncharacterized protein MICPUCDRAFT_49303 [Micromonas pusilla CCMP1545]EEH51147.1 predicted protein [Micromonas pusilla CCMP1545]|eukprot:XP_003064813.1 predicted protein [Micromonas pusilla CCMP1545]